MPKKVSKKWVNWKIFKTMFNGKKQCLQEQFFGNLKNCCENWIKRMLENQIICGYKFSQICQKKH